MHFPISSIAMVAIWRIIYKVGEESRLSVVFKYCTIYLRTLISMIIWLSTVRVVSVWGLSYSIGLNSGIFLLDVVLTCHIIHVIDRVSQYMLGVHGFT